MKDILTGALTRLVAADPDTIGEMFAGAARDSELLQLLDPEPAKPLNVKRFQEEIREHKLRPGDMPFGIRRLDDDKLIGETAFWNGLSQHKNPWVSIYIADRELWSKGYGSDALKTILRFGFLELGVHRVSLSTFEYNPRAIYAYERVGFVREGVTRGDRVRHGKRTGQVYMGILRSEWNKLHNE